MIWVTHPNCRCSVATGTEELVDTAVLEALDFQPRCEHSGHNDQMQQARHSGPATHWFLAIHCDHDNGEPYMGCAGWAAHVSYMSDRDWFCPQCKRVDIGRNMVINIGPIL